MQCSSETLPNAPSPPGEEPLPLPVEPDPDEVPVLPLDPDDPDVPDDDPLGEPELPDVLEPDDELPADPAPELPDDPGNSPGRKFPNGLKLPDEELPLEELLEPELPLVLPLDDPPPEEGDPEVPELPDDPGFSPGWKYPNGLELPDEELPLKELLEPELPLVLPLDDPPPEEGDPE